MGLFPTSDELVQAMAIVAERTVQNAPFDQTIRGEITELVSAETGEYHFEYEGEIFSAYSASPLISYSVGQRVYVTIPQANWSSRKLITGLAQDVSLSRDISSLATFFVPHSGNWLDFYFSEMPTEADLNGNAAPKNNGGICAASEEEKGSLRDPARFIDTLFARSAPGEISHTPTNSGGALSDLTPWEKILSAGDLKMESAGESYDFFQIKADFLTSFHSEHSVGTYGLKIKVLKRNPNYPTGAQWYDEWLEVCEQVERLQASSSALSTTQEESLRALIEKKDELNTRYQDYSTDDLTQPTAENIQAAIRAYQNSPTDTNRERLGALCLLVDPTWNPLLYLDSSNPSLPDNSASNERDELSEISAAEVKSKYYLAEYVLTFNSFMGDYYHYPSWTSQSVTFSAAAGTVIGLYSVELWQDGRMLADRTLQDNGTEGEKILDFNNIQVKNISINFGEVVDLNDGEYHCMITAPEGQDFFEAAHEGLIGIDRVTLVPHLYYQGKDLVEEGGCQVFWYRQKADEDESTVLSSSDQQVRYAGPGWIDINKLIRYQDSSGNTSTSASLYELDNNTHILTVKKAAVPWRWKYKAVIVYNQEAVPRAEEIYVYNRSSQYDLRLESSSLTDAETAQLILRINNLGEGGIHDTTQAPSAEDDKAEWNRTHPQWFGKWFTTTTGGTYTRFDGLNQVASDAPTWGPKNITNLVGNGSRTFSVLCYDPHTVAFSGVNPNTENRTDEIYLSFDRDPGSPPSVNAEPIGQLDFETGPLEQDMIEVTWHGSGANRVFVFREDGTLKENDREFQLTPRVHWPSDTEFITTSATYYCQDDYGKWHKLQLASSMDIDTQLDNTMDESTIADIATSVSQGYSSSKSMLRNVYIYRNASGEGSICFKPVRQYSDSRIYNRVMMRLHFPDESYRDFEYNVLFQTNNGNGSNGTDWSVLVRPTNYGTGARAFTKEYEVDSKPLILIKTDSNSYAQDLSEPLILRPFVSLRGRIIGTETADLEAIDSVEGYFYKVYWDVRFPKTFAGNNLALGSWIRLNHIGTARRQQFLFDLSNANETTKIQEAGGYTFDTELNAWYQKDGKAGTISRGLQGFSMYPSRSVPGAGSLENFGAVEITFSDNTTTDGGKGFGYKNVEAALEASNYTFFVRAQVDVYKAGSAVESGEEALAYAELMNGAKRITSVNVWYPIDVVIKQNGATFNYQYIDTNWPREVTYNNNGYNPDSPDLIYFYYGPKDGTVREVLPPYNLTPRTQSIIGRHTSEDDGTTTDSYYYNARVALDSSAGYFGTIKAVKQDANKNTEWEFFRNQYLHMQLWGNVDVNSWDGTSIQLNDEDASILAATLGAGYKTPYTNKFTGIVMGIDTSKKWTEDQKRRLSRTGDDVDNGKSDYMVGIYGYQGGVNSFGILENGTAYFGRADHGGRIVIDGENATIYGGANDKTFLQKPTIGDPMWNTMRLNMVDLTHSSELPIAEQYQIIALLKKRQKLTEEERNALPLYEQERLQWAYENRAKVAWFNYDPAQIPTPDPNDATTDRNAFNGAHTLRGQTTSSNPSIISTSTQITSTDIDHGPTTGGILNPSILGNGQRFFNKSGSTPEDQVETGVQSSQIEVNGVTQGFEGLYFPVQGSGTEVVTFSKGPHYEDIRRIEPNDLPWWYRWIWEHAYIKKDGEYPYYLQTEQIDKTFNDQNVEAILKMKSGVKPEDGYNVVYDPVTHRGNISTGDFFDNAALGKGKVEVYYDSLPEYYRSLDGLLTEDGKVSESKKLASGYRINYFGRTWINNQWYPPVEEDGKGLGNQTGFGPSRASTTPAIEIGQHPHGLMPGLIPYRQTKEIFKDFQIPGDRNFMVTYDGTLWAMNGVFMGTVIGSNIIGGRLQGVELGVGDPTTMSDINVSVVDPGDDRAQGNFMRLLPPHIEVRTLAELGLEMPGTIREDGSAYFSEAHIYGGNIDIGSFHVIGKSDNGVIGGTDPNPYGRLIQTGSSDFIGPTHFYGNVGIGPNLRKPLYPTGSDEDWANGNTKQEAPANVLNYRGDKVEDPFLDDQMRGEVYESQGNLFQTGGQVALGINLGRRNPDWRMGDEEPTSGIWDYVATNSSNAGETEFPYNDEYGTVPTWHAHTNIAGMNITGVNGEPAKRGKANYAPYDESPRQENTYKNPQYQWIDWNGTPLGRMRGRDQFVMEGHGSIIAGNGMVGRYYLDVDPDPLSDPNQVTLRGYYPHNSEHEGGYAMIGASPDKDLGDVSFGARYGISVQFDELLSQQKKLWKTVFGKTKDGKAIGIDGIQYEYAGLWLGKAGRPIKGNQGEDATIPKDDAEFEEFQKTILDRTKMDGEVNNHKLSLARTIYANSNESPQPYSRISEMEEHAMFGINAMGEAPVPNERGRRYRGHFWPLAFVHQGWTQNKVGGGESWGSYVTMMNKFRSKGGIVEGQSVLPAGPAGNAVQLENFFRIDRNGFEFMRGYIANDWVDEDIPAQPNPYDGHWLGAIGKVPRAGGGGSTTTNAIGMESYAGAPIMFYSDSEAVYRARGHTRIESWAQNPRLPDPRYSEDKVRSFLGTWYPYNVKDVIEFFYDPVTHLPIPIDPEEHGENCAPPFDDNGIIQDKPEAVGFHQKLMDVAFRGGLWDFQAEQDFYHPSNADLDVGNDKTTYDVFRNTKINVHEDAQHSPWENYIVYDTKVVGQDDEGNDIIERTKATTYGARHDYNARIVLGEVVNAHPRWMNRDFGDSWFSDFHSNLRPRTEDKKVGSDGDFSVGQHVKDATIKKLTRSYQANAYETWDAMGTITMQTLRGFIALGVAQNHIGLGTYGGTYAGKAQFGSGMVHPENFDAVPFSFYNAKDETGVNIWKYSGTDVTWMGGLVINPYGILHDSERSTNYNPYRPAEDPHAGGSVTLYNRGKSGIHIVHMPNGVVLNPDDIYKEDAKFSKQPEGDNGGKKSEMYLNTGIARIGAPNETTMILTDAKHKMPYAMEVTGSGDLRENYFDIHMSQFNHATYFITRNYEKEKEANDKLQQKDCWVGSDIIGEGQSLRENFEAYAKRIWATPIISVGGEAAHSHGSVTNLSSPGQRNALWMGKDHNKEWRFQPVLYQSGIAVRTQATNILHKNRIYMAVNGYDPQQAHDGRESIHAYDSYDLHGDLFFEDKQNTNTFYQNRLLYWGQMQRDNFSQPATNESSDPYTLRYENLAHVNVRNYNILTWKSVGEDGDPEEQYVINEEYNTEEKIRERERCIGNVGLYMEGGPDTDREFIKFGIGPNMFVGFRWPNQQGNYAAWLGDNDKTDAPNPWDIEVPGRNYPNKAETLDGGVGFEFQGEWGIADNQYHVYARFGPEDPAMLTKNHYTALKR